MLFEQENEERLRARLAGIAPPRITFASVTKTAQLR